MRGGSAAIKVGVVVAAIIIASYLMFKRVHEGFRGGGGFNVYALFKDGAGLVDKSKVTIAGLPAGKITKRSIARTRARIDIYLDEGNVIWSNAVIYKKSISLIGEYYLEIDPGSEFSPNPKDPDGPPIRNRRLKDGDQILNVVEAVGVNDLLPQIQSLVGTVDRVLQRDVRGIIDAIKKDIGELAGALKNLTTGPITDTVNNARQVIRDVGQSVKQLAGRLNAIAADIKPITAAARQDVGKILGDVRAVTGRLRAALDPKDPKKPGIIERVERIAARIDKTIDRVAGKLDGAMGDVAGITKNVKKITGDVAEGKGVLGKFVTDESLAKTVKETVTEAGKFVRGLTGLQTIVGLRSEYNILANSLKTYVSLRLQPKEDKYYLIELIDDPRGARSVTQTVTRTDDPNRPPLVRTEEIKVTDKFRFSFMFAKKVGFATFRFGIKENTGGLGVDLEFFKNKLEFSADIFNFQANVFPRLKIAARWMFYPRMFLVAGADDLLNARARTGAGGGRDYFLGAMIRFNDADLKGLMLFGGAAIGAAGN